VHRHSLSAIPFRISADETLDIGADTGTPVGEGYHVPFKFTGTIHKVDILLGDEKTSEAGQKAIEKAEADLGTSDRGQYFFRVRTLPKTYRR
jgi:hypothetical protein